MRKLILTATAMLLTQGLMAAEALTPPDFVAKASEAGMAEVELGKLASKMGSTPAVRAYGERMVADHTKAGKELEAIAMKKNLPVMKALNAKHQKAVTDLSAKSGKSFDDAYAQQMVVDHDEAVTLFTSATTLKDADLSAFASKTLPTLQAHQKDAHQMHGMH